MKLLSFDVGIVNLAYCIIDQTGENFKIEDWGIINLSGNSPKCQIPDKKGKICGKNAKYTYMVENVMVNACKTHIKCYAKPNIETEKCQKKCEETCCFIGKNMTACKKKATYCCHAHGYFCTPHMNSFTKAEINKSKPKIISKQNANKIPIQDLSVKLFRSLDEHPNFLRVDEVVIENQPTFINPTMKTISAFIYSYFSIRGLMNREGTIKIVKFYSPSNKLKIHKEHTEEELKKSSNDLECYTLTKELGKEYCRALITDGNKKLLDTYEKKDDLCDSFLQGFMYLFYKNKKIPDVYTKILDKIIKPEKIAQNKTKKNMKTVSRNEPEISLNPVTETDDTISLKKDDNSSIGKPKSKIKKSKQIIVKGKTQK